MNVMDLFSGIGGFSLGFERAGMTTSVFCEIDQRCRDVLSKRWPNAIILEDVKSIGDINVKKIDVICGGFPCQDISNANSGNMSGLEGSKSGLWSEFYKQICKNRPSFVVVENTPALRSRGLDRILNELAQIGYDAEWHCIPATAVDSPHSRDRVWIISYPSGLGSRIPAGQVLTRRHFSEYFSRWKAEPDICRVADGVPSQSHRLRQLGNSIVPQIAEVIGRAIMEAERNDQEYKEKGGSQELNLTSCGIIRPL